MDYPDADLVDAARVSLVRQHMDAANPMPDNVETAGAHNAAYSQALDQVAAGERVAVTDVAPPIAPVAGKATDTPNFKAWFGDSRVVDEQGAPLVLYHGTASDVAEFDASRLSAEGIHLSASPDVANTYANSRAMDGGRGANVVPVYAKADRVLDVPMITTDTIRQAAADGFDAVRRGDHVVVMRPEQIKSAIGNSGKFDPNSASLTDNPMADWGAGVNRALAEMAKTEPKPAPAHPCRTTAPGAP